jgi:hypothetical protein
MKPLIRSLVLGVLGRPDRFLDIQVHHLWDNHFRVNVIVGSDLAACIIAQSFFLVFDDAGDMLSSTPTLAAAA